MIHGEPHPPIVVTHDSGARFAIQIRSHEIMVDQTVRAGGEDSAPSPLELLGASLGSCIAYYVHQFCVTRGIPTEGMRVEVSEKRAKNPSRVEDFMVRVVLPEDLPTELASRLERIVDVCPAHNTLTMGAKLAVTFETAVPEPTGA